MQQKKIKRNEESGTNLENGNMSENVEERGTISWFDAPTLPQQQFHTFRRCVGDWQGKVAET